MTLRIPVVFAIVATVGAFVCIDWGKADAIAVTPGISDRLPAATPAPSVPKTASANWAQLSWFALMPESEMADMNNPGNSDARNQKATVQKSPKIRAAADVVSGLPPVRAIHPSLIGKVSNLHVRVAEKRAGDRIEQRKAEARAGDALAPRHGDTVSRY